MGFLLHIFYPYGFILQALAIVHFLRRRPDGYWFWIIVFGSGLGATVYLLVEALPDLQLMRTSLHRFPRRRRIVELEAIVRDNPAPANYEELGDLYFQDKKFARARDCFDKAIFSRTDSNDPFYRRALCLIELGEFGAALPDLERVVTADPKYDFNRAAALLAQAYARTGKTEKAATEFEQVTKVSTLTETQYNYAAFLFAQGRRAEARDLAQRILAKRASMPRFQRRKDRPWFRKTSNLLRSLSA